MNIPGREGAVTGGTFDQSNRVLAGVFESDPVRVPGLAVSEAASTAGAPVPVAQTLNARPSMQAPRQNRDSGLYARTKDAENVLDAAGLMTSAMPEARERGRLKGYSGVSG